MKVRSQARTGRKESSSLWLPATQVQRRSRSRHLSKSRLQHRPSTGAGSGERTDAIVVVVFEHCRRLSRDLERYLACCCGFACLSIQTCLSRGRKMTWSSRQKTWTHSCGLQLHVLWFAIPYPQALGRYLRVPSTSEAEGEHKAAGMWVCWLPATRGWRRGRPGRVEGGRRWAAGSTTECRTWL